MRGGILTLAFVGIALAVVDAWFEPAPKAAEPQVRSGRQPGEVITRPDFGERWVNQIKVGSEAPDFTLPLLDKAGESSRSQKTDKPQTVSLRALHKERPVVLIFGSITCPPFRRQVEGIDRVYQEFKDRAEFLFVYIREAHPDSVLSVVDKRGDKSLVKIPQPSDIAARTTSAGYCQRTAELEMPIAVDLIDNHVGKTYAGWPNRMLVVGTDGRVLLNSGPSPGGANAGKLRDWLTGNLKKSQ